jgi:hypothetical protein
MHGKRSYYIYIMTNPTHTVLYVGITNNLKRRVHEHKLVEGVYEQVQRDLPSLLRGDKRLSWGAFTIWGNAPFLFLRNIS